MKSAEFELPIKEIGETQWQSKLENYLKNHSIDFLGIEKALVEQYENEKNISLPEQLKEYLIAFGATESDDFMYGLMPLPQFKLLFAANISFISFNFKMYDINTMIHFAQSPGNDPLCFDKDSGEIYLFSHDPIKKARVFADFNQYLLFQIIETEKLLGDNLSESREQELKSAYLSGEGIDYKFRDLKL